MKKFRILFVFIAVLLLAGCIKNPANEAIPPLPDNPVQFELKEYSSDTKYDYFEYDNRQYLPFAEMANRFEKENIGECLGYVIKDGKADEKILVCMINGDSENNYMMLLNCNKLIPMPSFYRALDTKDKNIEIYPFMENQNYDIWQ